MDMPILLEKVFEGQDVQRVAPEPEYFPAKQLTQAVDVPSTEAVPAIQAAQIVPAIPYPA